MSKYAILNGDLVLNVIKSDTEPAGVTSVNLDGKDASISSDWRYNSDTDTFIKPLSFTTQYSDTKLSPSKPILDISCSFNRDCDEITSDDLVANSTLINITNYNWDGTNNVLSFTIDTGSMGLADFVNDIEITLPKQHNDSLGYRWDLFPIDIPRI